MRVGGRDRNRRNLTANCGSCGSSTVARKCCARSRTVVSPLFVREYLLAAEVRFEAEEPEDANGEEEAENYVLMESRDLCPDRRKRSLVSLAPLFNAS